MRATAFARKADAVHVVEMQAQDRFMLFRAGHIKEIFGGHS